MSMNVGPAKIALVEFDGRSVRCSAFENRLELVKAVIDNGSIGGGMYGSEGHVAALDEVAKLIAAIRAVITGERTFVKKFLLTDETSKTISDYLAREIFKIGDRRNAPATRIQYMSGLLTNGEVAGGGLCEEALASAIHLRLRMWPSEGKSDV